MRKVWVRGEEGEVEKITLSGTKEGIKALGEGRLLVLPNRNEWESEKPFAILALTGGSNGDIRHRVDIVRIEEGSKKLNWFGEKKFIIGLCNSDEFWKNQCRIEVPPKC